jgi:ketosteroid isomerase-like protein
MTYKFSFKTLIALLFFTMQYNAAAAQTGKEKILALQQKRFAAMISKDTASLRSCTDDDIVYIHSNGLVQDKAAFISSVSSGTIVYQQMSNKEQQVRIYKKAAVINGVVHVKGTYNGKEFEMDLRYTDVYIKKNGWKMASWQSLKL